jgi:chromate transporter
MSGPPALPLPALAGRFLRLGALAWGGPVVQIAALHREFVEHERWVDEARFRQVLAVYQALPGPEATELCIWFGTLARGRLGGFVAGLCFVLPGFLLMLLASWLLLGRAWPPTLAAAFGGMQAAVVALVVRAAWRLLRTAVHGQRPLQFAAGAATLGSLAGAPFGIALLGGGLLGATWRSRWHWLFVPILLGWALAAALALAAGHAVVQPPLDAPAGPPPGFPALFGSGLQAGALTFGGAYTAIPFLQADATGPQGWMTLRQFLDGLAVGGVMPAPLVIFSTWVGWAGGGLPGALLLTLGMFLPAFTFPLLLHDRLERLVRIPRLHAMLDGVTAAVAGLIVAVAVQLTATLSSWPRLGIALLALAALARLRSRLAVLPVMAAAALAGLLTG